MSEENIEETINEEQVVNEQNEESQENSEATKQEENSKKDKEYNFARLREEQEQLKRERDEYARKLKEYEESKKAAQEEEDDDDDDPYSKKLKQLERQVKEFQTATAAQNTELKLKSEYPDFYNVVNEKNIAALRKEYPELASTIQSSGDLYTKAVSAYTAIKKFGIVTDQNSTKQVNNNTTKPRPTSSISPQESGSPLTQANAFANGLTSDLKKQLFQEMLDCAKRR